MKRITAAIIAVSLVVGLGALGVLLYRNHADAQSQQGYYALRAQLGGLVSARAEDVLIPQNLAVGLLPQTDDPVLLSLRTLAQEHPDMIGWLRIDGTEIDYPVMRSPEEAERYLHMDFDGRYNRAGTLFMLPISDPATPNENMIIYGHHMKNGSMFGSLPTYETLAGWEAQPYISFDTLYARGSYKIIAAFRTSIGAADEFSYYEYEWLDDEETFDRYMRGVMANRLYDTGETAEYGDKLISLSTCDYHEPNGRLVVVAKLMPEEMDGTEVTEVQGDA